MSLFVEEVVLTISHVIIPRGAAKLIPPNRLLTETEWRNIGVQQSRGWVHFMIHKPGMLSVDVCSNILEPHVLIFRRKLEPAAVAAAPAPAE